jgi:hypothetical protein
MTDAPPAGRPLARWGSRLAFLALLAAGPAVLVTQFDRMAATRVDGVRLLFDDFDVSVYFYSSRWAVGDGVLYAGVPSEYTPAANLLFAAARVVSAWADFRPEPAHGFAIVWMSLGWAAYLGLVWRAAADHRWPVVVLFLHPAVLFFALLRFDIFPAGCTYLMLAAARRDWHLRAGWWLGAAIALKGYPVFVGPAFAAFVWRRAGARRAVAASVLAAAPLAAGTAAVYSYAGWDGVTAPYRLHAGRGLDSAGSTYEAAADALGWEWARGVEEHRRLPLAGGVAAGLLAARCWPPAAGPIRSPG